MKAVCCICFNLLDGLHIAACPFGHTFHEECLIRWMDTSSTCPSCRTYINKNRIIKRLVFDIHESCHEDVDNTLLLNQINSLKTKLSVTVSDSRLSKLYTCVRRCDIVTQSIFQEMRDLNKKYVVKYNNLRKALSKRTLLQRNVSKPNLSCQKKAKTDKLEMKYLRTDFAWMCNELKQTRAAGDKIFSELSKTTHFHHKLLNYPNINDCVEDEVNTDTCTSANVSNVSRENLKLKFVSEIDGPKLKSANVSAASGHLEDPKLTKSNTVVDDVPHSFAPPTT